MSSYHDYEWVEVRRSVFHAVVLGGGMVGNKI
jgi:hypothetical protein